MARDKPDDGTPAGPVGATPAELVGATPAQLVGATPTGTFPITFDGRRIDARPGQSIAAVLWSAGILAWRTTRVSGRPRGAFCGIGQCYDCLATVNGAPNRRACLVTARPGDAVTTQEGHGHAGSDT